MKENTKLKNHSTIKSGEKKEKAEILKYKEFGNNLVSILNASHDGFVLYNNQLEMITFNESFQKIITEITSRPPENDFDVFGFIRPESEKKMDPLLKKVLQGEIIEYDLPRLIADKTKKYLHVHIYPVKNQTGDIDGLCVSLRDITIRRTNQQNLQYNSLLLGNMRDIVLATDLDFKITSFNKAAEEMCMVNAEDVYGQVTTSVFDFSYAGISKEDVIEKLVKEGYWQGTIVFNRKDGKKLYLLSTTTTIKDSEDNTIGYMAVQTDITNKIQLEELINKQQIYTRSIFENTTEALFMLDRENRIVTFNNRAQRVMEKFVGVKIENGVDLIEILPDFRRDDARSKIAEARLGYLIDYEVQYPGGNWLWVSFIPVRDANGLINDICVSLRDITHRKNMENNLRKNERQYHSLVNSLAEGIIFQTFDKRIISCNESARKILDAQKDILEKYGFPLQGSNIISSRNEKLDIKEMIRNETYEGRSIKGLIAGIEKEGKTQWLHINIEPVKNEENISHACVISFTDITESKVMQEEMEILSMVAKETINGVIITDNKKGIEWVNEGFTKILGYSKEEAIGKHPLNLFHGPETDERTREHIRQQISKGLPFNVELINYTKDGQKKWIHVEGNPLKTADGGANKYVGIQTDITERHNMIEQSMKDRIERQKAVTLATVKAQEAERNELGKELHDNINQILAAVKMQLSFYLSSDKHDTGFIKESLENINMAFI